jgi:hypothetical protein
MGPTSFMMTPTHSLSGSEMAESSSSWPCSNESPISFSAQKDLGSFELDGLDLDRHFQSPLDAFHLHAPPSPGGLRAHRKMMVHEIQRTTTELRRGQNRASRRASGGKSEGAVAAVRRAMCKCDYPGCHKAFLRNEHLKRHKQRCVYNLPPSTDLSTNGHSIAFTAMDLIVSRAHSVARISLTAKIT